MSMDIKSWAKKYKELTDSDETIKAMAKYYTCSFLFDMGDANAISQAVDVSPDATDWVTKHRTC